MLFLFPLNFREPDPPQPFKYLKDGDTFSVRPETRNGNKYWFIRKMKDGKKAVAYVGPVGSLTQESVNEAVNSITTQLQGEMSQ